MSEELDRCDYCMRIGRKKNLKKLPEELDSNQVMEYCPDCYLKVYKEVVKFPWNK